MHQPIHLLSISGTLRDGSTNTAVLNTVPMLAGDGVESVLHGGMAELPQFNPDDEREGQPAHAAVASCEPRCRGTFPIAASNRPRTPMTGPPWQSVHGR